MVRQAGVSVIIPCYRCVQTIERALASVVAQTMQPKEVVLVDDCSGDGTLDELYRLQATQPKGWISVVALAHNKGPASARNAGWHVATQRFIAFLDADDTWHPQKIEIQYLWMETHPDVVITGHKCLQRTNKQIMYHKLFNHNYSVNAHLVSKLYLLFRNQFATRSVMLKNVIPFQFQEGKKYSEDYLLWLEIICSGGDGYILDAYLAYSYKNDYGDSGLSGDLLLMQLGQIDTYRIVRKHNYIGKIFYFILCCYSWARYVRRLFWVIYRRLLNSIFVM